jgi:hypothetical protein
MIFAGTTATTLRSELVRAAYLGSEAVEGIPQDGTRELEVAGGV